MDKVKKVVFLGVPGMNKGLIEKMEKYVKEEYDNLEYSFLGENTLSQKDLVEKCKDADILISWDQEVTEESYSSMNLKAYCAASTGYNAANVKMATKHGVIVTNVVNYCIDEVATHAITLILACARKLCKMITHVKSGEWGTTVLEPIKRFSGSTVGLYGFGNIPKSLAKKLSGFNVSILAHDPYVSPAEAEKYNVKLVDFNSLLKNSDYLSIHAPLLESTKGVFNKEAFSHMKPTSYIINTSRGGLIKQNDLYKALIDKKIAGAALDVLENEPPTIEDKKIIDLPNTIVTAHCAFYSEESSNQMIKMTAEEVGRILRGEKAINIINPEVVEGQ